jgi:hypothetical protein
MNRAHDSDEGKKKYTGLKNLGGNTSGDVGKMP